MSADLREVFSADNIQEAHLIRVALEEVGIEAQVVGDHLQGALGDLPATAIAPRVWVREDDFDQARKIIEAHEANRHSSAPSAMRWKCEKCGEPNEPNFELCWKCQTVYGGGA